MALETGIGEGEAQHRGHCAPGERCLESGFSVEVLPMKRSIALVLLVLAACQPPQKRVDSEAIRNQELGVVMSLSVQEASQLKLGQWVLYTVRTEGNPTAISTRVAVVGVEGGCYWIE